uniref:Uncharacterized protein n=1 Tax=Arundo donax TaxID=35708 RepID=A0A0A9QKR6_ARUDO
MNKPNTKKVAHKLHSRH